MRSSSVSIDPTIGVSTGSERSIPYSLRFSRAYLLGVIQTPLVPALAHNVPSADDKVSGEYPGLQILSAD
ncbi:hypothetical protein Tco_1467740 [Tanacetum coccineum]